LSAPRRTRLGQWATALSLAAAAVAWTPALAGRPFATEDAGVLDRGACEIESFVARETASDADSLRGSSLQVSCGLLSRAQFGLGMSREKAGSERSTALAIGGKVYLLKQDETNPGFTIAYRHARSKLVGESWQREATDVLAVLSLPLAGMTVHANLGGSRLHSARHDSTLWALALERPMGSGVDVGIESYGDDRDPAWVGLGVRWMPLPDLFVDASLARQLGGARARSTTIGLKFVF